MTFTYNPTVLAATPKFQIRLKIGDQVENNGILPGGGNFQDEEIDYTLAAAANVIDVAAVSLLESAASRWASFPTQRLGPQSINTDQVSKNLLKAAAVIREESPSFGAGTWSVSLKRADGYSAAADRPDGTPFDWTEEQ